MSAIDRFVVGAIEVVGTLIKVALELSREKPSDPPAPKPSVRRHEHHHYHHKDK